jgi:hypothetical protein
MPLTILPGTIQLARSPVRETCMPPSTAVSMCPPRIIPNESEESKYDAPDSTVTVSLPALMRLASMVASVGYGPVPRMPFSEWRTTRTSAVRYPGIIVGKPIPRLTYSPSIISAAARSAMFSRVHPATAVLMLVLLH